MQQHRNPLSTTKDITVIGQHEVSQRSRQSAIEIHVKMWGAESCAIYSAFLSLTTMSRCCACSTKSSWADKHVLSYNRSLFNLPQRRCHGESIIWPLFGRLSRLSRHGLASQVSLRITALPRRLSPWYKTIPLPLLVKTIKKPIATTSLQE